MAKSKNSSVSFSRHGEIDAWRGIAIILMIAFHIYIAYSLVWGKLVSIPWYWWLIGKSASTSFLILVGISLWLSYARAQTQKKSPRKIRQHLLVRGLKIFGLGLLITLATFLTIPHLTIYFGILHLIGFSIMVSEPFLQTKKTLWLWAILLITVGIIIQYLPIDLSWFLSLGMMPQRTNTLDFFPILPYFGIVVLGMALGKQMYKETGFKSSPQAMTKWPLLAWLGRHSLLIYLLHAPVIVICLLALKNIL